MAVIPVVMRIEMFRNGIRAAALVITLLLAVACQSMTTTPSQIVWGDEVPLPAPDVVAAQPVVTRGSDTITLMPISPTGAQIGVEYRYDMPHCGIGGAIDVDGSFWDAVGVGSPSVTFDGQAGTFRLDTATKGTFTATNGDVLQLMRHAGAKEFRYCV